MLKPILVQHPETKQHVDVAPFLDLVLETKGDINNIEEIKDHLEDANRFVNLYCIPDASNESSLRYLHSFHFFMYMMKDLFNQTSILETKGGKDV